MDELNDEGEPIELRNKSEIIKNIKERNTMRIYVDRNSVSKTPKDLLTQVKNIMKMVGEE